MKYIEEQTFSQEEYDGSGFSELRISDCRFLSCTFLENQIEDVSIQCCHFHKCIITNPVYRNLSLSGCTFRECILIGLDWAEFSNGSLLPFRQLEKCSLKI